MSQKRQPTAEQLAAVVEYARQNGPYWKERLRDDWWNASYPTFRGEGAYLQQLRNEFGPRWLETFRLPKETT